MQATLVYDGVIAGTLSARADGRGLVFNACNPYFDVIQGSTFANRHAAQKAVERVAKTQGMPDRLSASAAVDIELHDDNRRIRSAMV